MSGEFTVDFAWNLDEEIQRFFKTQKKTNSIEDTIKQFTPEKQPAWTRLIQAILNSGRIVSPQICPAPPGPFIQPQVKKLDISQFFTDHALLTKELSQMYDQSTSYNSQQRQQQMMIAWLPYFRNRSLNLSSFANIYSISADPATVLQYLVNRTQDRMTLANQLFVVYKVYELCGGTSVFPNDGELLEILKKSNVDPYYVKFMLTKFVIEKFNRFPTV